MSLTPSSIERCLEVLGGLVRAHPELNAEFEGSTEAFFQGGRPGAAEDLRETLLAGRRHLEWFLLEHHSPTLRGSAAEKLGEAFREAAARSTEDEEDGERLRGELEVAHEALLRSHTGVFEVETAGEDEGAWARDLGGFGTYALLTVGLEGRVRSGDLLVGRLYPTGDGGNVASPTVAIVRSPEINAALTRDLERIRNEGSVNVLRISQHDIEAMFFAEALPGQEAAAEAEAEQAPEDPAAAARALLDAAGLPPALAASALRELQGTPRDPGRLMHGMEDPLARVMETLAFDTDVDLDRARAALLQAWDLISAPAAGTEAAAPAPAEAVGDDEARGRAVDAFAQGRARGEDAAELMRKLEEDLGIDGGEADGADSDVPAPDFPGVVGAMIDEMRWELAATRDDHDPATLDPLKHLAAFAEPIGVFEELRGRDLFQFATFWVLETRALASDDEAVALVHALREFCEWALDAHEVDLGSEFLDALDGLETSLPRARRANAALPTPSADAEGQGFEVVAVDGAQPESFEVSGDRLRERSSGDEFTVILPPSLREHLRAGDHLRGTIRLEGDAEVLTCYPPEARSLLG